MKYPITAQRLAEAMTSADIVKAVDLVDKSGVSKSSISQYLSGSHKPSDTKAKALAEALDVSPLWLMGFDVPKDRTAFLYTMLDDDDKEVISQMIRVLLTNKKYTIEQ